MSERKLPINRINKFFSEEDYKLEQEFGRESMEHDGNFVVVLFPIDRDKTQSDNLYGEAPKDSIRFLPPVELRVSPVFEKSDNKTYNSSSGSLRYMEDGNLTFVLYSEQLSELNTDIRYGDYVGYQVNETTMRYYVVSDDGKKNFDNESSIMGYKPTFRTIVCTIADKNEFRAI